MARASCSAAEIEDRAPRAPIGARHERAGVEAHAARESGTLFGGRSRVGALEFVDLAEGWARRWRLPRTR